LPNGPIIIETGSQHNLLPEGETADEKVYSKEGLPGSRSHRAVSQQIPDMLNSATGDVDLVLKASNDSLKLKASRQSLQVLNLAAVNPLLDDSNDSHKLDAQYDFSALPFAADTIDDSSLFHSFGGIQTINVPSLHPSSLAKTLFPFLLRIVFFLPWCVAVGGTIVTCPNHLELIAFGPGYLNSPPKGIHRFAHWADTGMHHVWIFLGFLASIWWIYPTLGWMLIGGVVAQTANAWHDFEVDRSVPLGEDDRQTMYLIATQYGIPDELMGIRKTDKGYLVERLDRPRVELEGLDDN
jgi:hypothetical protein